MTRWRYPSSGFSLPNFACSNPKQRLRRSDHSKIRKGSHLPSIQFHNGVLFLTHYHLTAAQILSLPGCMLLQIIYRYLLVLISLIIRTQMLAEM
jgi:hypothetical protein